MDNQKKVLQLEIVTQEKLLLQKEVTAVTAVTLLGEITVLPGHIPLFTKLDTGELRYRQQNSDEVGSYAVSGGFMDVNPEGKVTILADYALRSDDINEALAAKAKQEAQEAMKNKQSERNFKLAEASLKKALNELNIARRRKSKSQN